MIRRRVGIQPRTSPTQRLGDIFLGHLVGKVSAQIAGLRNASQGGQIEPLVRGHVVQRQALSRRVQDAEVILRFRDSGFRLSAAIRHETVDVSAHVRIPRLDQRHDADW